MSLQSLALMAQANRDTDDATDRREQACCDEMNIVLPHHEIREKSAAVHREVVAAIKTVMSDGDTIDYYIELIPIGKKLGYKSGIIQDCVLKPVLRKLGGKGLTDIERSCNYGLNFYDWIKFKIDVQKLLRKL